MADQAQAVLCAAARRYAIDGDLQDSIAAALRAAADRARRGPEHWEGSYPNDYEKGWNEAVDYFTIIANELENHQ